MIQAKSLSSVLDLADNPPLSFHHGLEGGDPLVLYIARVPGSRGWHHGKASCSGLAELTFGADVFLTTTRPLQKVVTAQDVQSSLYYIHADSDDDERIRRSLENRGSDTSGDPFTSPDANQPIQRSPLPKGVDIATEKQPSELPAAISNHPRPGQYRSGMAQFERKPVGSSVQPSLHDEPSRSNPPGTHVMGPRAMHKPLHSNVNPRPELPQGKENLMPRRWSEQPPVTQPTLPPRLRAPARIQDLAQGSRHNYYENAITATRIEKRIPSPDQRPYGRQSTNSANEGFSLTFIRRYGGSQWNIGKIFSLREEADLWDRKPTSRQDDLTVHISTPGYLRFCDPISPVVPVTPNLVFERRLTKVRRPSRDSSSKEKDGASTNSRKSRMSIDFRRLSTPRVEKKTDAMYSASADEREPTSIKGYGFHSPWNGRCEFSQGISGHALKCKHTAPTEGSQAATMSELRFNLPAFSNLAAASPRQRSSPEKAKNTKGISYFPHASGDGSPPRKSSDQGSDEVDDTLDHFDLSLGQERAGGGFGGKQAKLGKLIIEPDGLKMLDLLVAVNMGLWWKAYEKSA